MVRDYVTKYYEPAAIGTNTMTADAGAPARELAAWKQRVVEAWPDVRVRVGDGPGADGGAAGVMRDIAVELDTGSLGGNEIVVQLLHGPLLADGSFDEALLNVMPMAAGDDGRFHAAFAPDRAGRWGVTARALPTHPHLRNLFDTGLVTIG